MEVFLIKTLQLLLCFALLVILHEAGHFLIAKLFKVRVEKFCIFFDPWKSWKLFTFRGTDYHIGWIPLGGYVKISGMIDESMDTEQMKQPAQPWEFRSKPAWQRLLIMIGGVLVNFLLALFLYAMILFTWGETYTPIRDMSHGFKFNKEAQDLGFRDGDIPLSADGKTFTRFNANIYRDISEAHTVTVLRDGKEVNLSLPGDLNLLQMLQNQPPFAAPLMPSVIDSVLPASVAQKAGVLQGDTLVAFQGVPLTTWNEFDIQMEDIQNNITLAEEEGHKAEAARLHNVSLVVKHAGVAAPDTIALTLDSACMMGIVKASPLTEYKTVTRTYTLFESFPAGVKHGWNVLCGYVDDLKYVFTSEGAKSIGSFGTIGSLFPDTWNWMRFWELTAFISIMLAFVNILPIPALDGGHVLFLLVEVITRRKPSEKFMEYAQMAGMIFLFALMLFAIFNDVRRFLF